MLCPNGEGRSARFTYDDLERSLATCTQWIAQTDVWTGLDQGHNSKLDMHTFADTTVVQFGKLSEQEIAAYIATGTNAANLFTPSKRLPADLAPAQCSVSAVCKPNPAALTGCTVKIGCAPAALVRVRSPSYISTPLSAVLHVNMQQSVGTQVSVMARLEPMASKGQPASLSKAFKETTSM